MYKSPLMQNINHQNLYDLSQVKAAGEAERALQDAAQAELFRRIDASQKVKHVKRVLKVEAEPAQADA